MQSRLKCVAFRFFVISFVASLILHTGCGPRMSLMPTPNLYAWTDADPFANVTPEFQSNRVEVLYLTDRKWEGETPTGTKYGYQRSKSVAFGISEVEIGKDISWERLKDASRSRSRSINEDLSVRKTTELTRFPETPRHLIQTVMAETKSPTALLGDVEDEAQAAAEAVFQREFSARLARTPTKEAYVFVHGYNNIFTDSVETIAQLWHFFGREGVPIAYSWPAGSAGLLRGYSYDSVSSEFTVFHLKQMLRLIANNPDLKKLNILAHSRGTDATLNALRELHMEIYASKRNTRDVLKLGTVVLAAPDIDIDIVIQEVTNIRLAQVPERFVMYVCEQDQALGFSKWLFGGLSRLGELKADMFKPEELEALRKSATIQIIDVRVTQLGVMGHDYYYSNPAVSSDLVLLMRYGLSPGLENGRPLRTTKNGFWSIDDKYPAPLGAGR